MTKEEALKVLVKMRAWRRWGKGEQNEKDMPEMPEQKEVDEAFDVYIETLSQPSLPSNLDEAAEEYKQGEIDTYADYYDDTGEPLCFMEALKDAFKAGAEWMAGQGFAMGATFRIYDDENPFVNFEDHKGSKEQSMKFFKDGDKVIVQIRKK